MEDKRKIELLNDFFGSEITTEDNDAFNCDYSCYEEITADGYEVYVFTGSPNGPVIVNEEVYYYDHTLPEEIIRVYEYNRNVIHIDKFLYDHLDLDKYLLGLFEEYVDEIVDTLNLFRNGHNSLSETEIKKLKEEYEIEERTEST